MPGGSSIPMQARSHDYDYVATHKNPRGTQLTIPDLRPMYADWKSGLSPHCEELRDFVNEKIDLYIKDTTSRRKIIATDLGWFVSLAYPNSKMEQLKTMAMMAMTFFVFDDTIDREIRPGMTDFASDFDLATKLRQDTLIYIRSRLCPGSSGHGSAKDSMTCAPAEVAGFEYLVPAVLAASRTQVNLPKLADDYQEFIDATAVEQRLRLSGEAPTVEEYWSYRHGVGAVGAFCTMHQYIAGSALPDELAWNEEEEKMRHEVSIQTCLCNDLYSLMKELNEGTPSNMICILMSKHGMSLDTAVREILQQMHSSAMRFNEAAVCLRSKGRNHNAETEKQLGRFIEAYETFQTGCFSFYLGSPRYNILQYRQKDGSYVIPL